jgi:hypothetical protein
VDDPGLLGPGGLGPIGRLLITIGAAILVVGLILTLADRVPGLGRLPGDFVFRRRGVSVYLPLATSILLSIVLTLLLNLFGRR